MKSLFIYAIHEDELNNLPYELEYLFINTLNIDSFDKAIKPNFNIHFKFMYIHRIRIDNHFYIGRNLNISLPFNAKYLYNNFSFFCYNFEIKKKDLIYYIDEIHGDDCEEIFNNLVYWFNICSKNRCMKYTYQTFENSICIYNNTTIENVEINNNDIDWLTII